MKYTRLNPYLAKIKKREWLSPEESGKGTLHVVLDIKGSGITYETGDTLGVYPVNSPALVDKTLRALGAAGEEQVEEKRSGTALPLCEYLTYKGNLCEPSRKFLEELAARSPESALGPLLEGEGDLKAFLEGRQIWDLLNEHSGAAFTPQRFCDLLKPLLPRFYSIASSQKETPDEIHLTVALVAYEAFGHKRYGVCTYYLSEIASAENSAVPIYIQPHKGFTLPEDHETPIIMIGPGTGVAPFRGFMQERASKKIKGRSWLFFGERYEKHHFFYKEFWMRLVEERKLRLDLAFSRDQEHKIYVQHRMEEKGEEIYRWIQEGAVIYVCGDAKRMAKEVDRALHRIIEKHGQKDAEATKAYIKKLRASRRYLRDVY